MKHHMLKCRKNMNGPMMTGFIVKAIAPYTRFVRAEQEKLQQMQAELTEAQQMQGRLRAEIERML